MGEGIALSYLFIVPQSTLTHQKHIFQVLFQVWVVFAVVVLWLSEFYWFIETGYEEENLYCC